MANGNIIDSVADDYLTQFDRSIGVVGISKLHEWSSLQELTHNSQLTFLQKDFHGLHDFDEQMDAYSASNNIILEPAWQVIKSIVPNNPNIASMMFLDPQLGFVGSMFRNLHSFGQVFALSPEVLNDPLQTAEKIASISSGNAGF